ncbi:MAG: hypothetical protein ACQET8_17090 [Bacillota bacterium]
MVKALAKNGAKWPEQIPTHIIDKLNEVGQDYTLLDVINICEEIISLYDNGIDTKTNWSGIPVTNIMMSTVTYRNKFKRYL